MANKILYFVSSLLVITKSDLSCSVGNGCSDSGSCDVEFVANQVYGCGGIWGSDFKGVSNGGYLCGEGYTICATADQASGLGLTSELCSSTDIGLNDYYVSLQGADASGSDQYTCTDGGINNLFGCANPGSDSWIITDSTETITCGPFGAVVSTQSAGDGQGWAVGWEPWGGNGNDEVQTTHHWYTKTDSGYTTTIKGGVMCCKATQAPSTAPTAAPDFSDAQKERIDVWKSRAVYQILTDRFALAEDDYDYNCTDLSKYCGGKFQGIINKLDYIEGMGYDAIWISPVIENTEDGYHGYWAKNINEINPEFGTEADLIALAEALHDRDMLLMIDVVINHMGQTDAITTGDYNYTYDYSGFVPFDDESYYHDSCDDQLCDIYCSISDDDFKYNIEGTAVQQCRLAGLPDLDQSNNDTMAALCYWVKNSIQGTWMADAIRLDTIPEVAIEHWETFLSDECMDDDTFNVGEYLYGDYAVVGKFQPTLDSLFAYPAYYTIKNVFGDVQYDPQYKMDWLSGIPYHSQQNFLDYAALGLFTDNHDNRRWLCDYPDMTNYKNALLFIHTFPGIPYGYYGTEQGFDGCSDPDNREPLWPSEYDTETELYQYIATVNKARKGLEIYDGDFAEVWKSEDIYAYSRGDNTLILLTNNGNSFNTTIIVNTLKYGTYCNVLDTADDKFQDCFEKTGDENLLVDFDKGAGKFYVATDDIPIVTTKFYEPTEDSGDDTTTTEKEVDGIDRVYGIYAVFMAILMTFLWN